MSISSAVLPAPIKITGTCRIFFEFRYFFTKYLEDKIIKKLNIHNIKTYNLEIMPATPPKYMIKIIVKIL